MEEYFSSWFSWRFLWVMLLSSIATSALSQFLDIYKKPTRRKTGIICAVAFIFGTIAMFIAK